VFLFSVLEAIGVGVGLVFALPWALVLLPAERRSTLLLALTTLALSVGSLTLWLLVLALVDALTLGASLAGIAVLCGAGMVVAVRRGDFRLSGMQPAGVGTWGNPLLIGAALIVLAMVILITFSALYWPFSDFDAISIYANHSRSIFQVRSMPDGDGLYESYPMLLPLSYVYSYLLAGEINEYLARIVIAALAIGSFGAAFELGRTLVSTTVGALTALLLALTPSYVRWGSSGYTDIPAAFFVTLALVFAARLAQSGDDRDALLVGILTGLAAWTKNSVLPVAGSMALWLAYLYWQRRVTWRSAGLALAGALATAGPWYLRNVLLWGHIVAPTVWTDQAQHTVKNLAPFVTYPDRFFAPGIVFMLGFVWALAAAFRSAGARQDGARLLLVTVLPFAAAWWWMASYDTRFLLAALPGIAVMGAWATVAIWSALAARYSLDLKRAFQVALLVIVLLLALPSARKALTFKGDLARDPLMDDDKRHRIVLGAIYDVADYLTALPAEGRLLTDNHFLPFHAGVEGRLQVIVGGLPQRESLGRYDYLVLGGALPDVVAAEDVELLTTIGGFTVYRVVYR